jgi:hypothetical protein
MAERPTSPAAIGRELGVEASLVSYHARALEALDLVEQVGERPVRGAVEHFYRTVSLSGVTEDEYASLPLMLRKVWIEAALSLYVADAMHSIETETVLAQTDCEIARTPMKVDQQGWEDIREIYVEAQERVMVVKGEAETRLATDDELKPKPILSFFSLFEMPPAKTVNNSLPSDTPPRH